MARTIVVVEDEQDVADILQEVLEMEGYAVKPFSHPDALERQLADMQPDLFLIDIMLPKTSGIELAQQLRDRHYSDIPMIAMTASLLMSRVATETGMFADTLNKPFDLDDLLASVEQCLHDVTGHQPRGAMKRKLSGQELRIG